MKRNVRDEPKWYIYKHQVWINDNTIPAEEIVEWLKERYMEESEGCRYRVQTYRHKDGHRYVDSILLETLTRTDMAFMKLRWGCSMFKINRTAAAPKRPRLTQDQRQDLDERIQNLTNEFYDSIEKTVVYSEN